MDLHCKTALVTGGTKGIGAAAAIELARAGATVSICARDIDSAAARSTLEQIRHWAPRSILLQGDLSRAEDCARVAAQTAEVLGEVEVLVHSAGGPAPGNLLDITPAIWHGAFAVHVHAIFHLCRAVVPGMKRKRSGAIVLVGSVAGLRGLKSNIAYQAVKGAIPQIARGLAYELADDDIRVNCVAPGVIRTDFHLGMPEEVRLNNLKNRIPLHREGAPEQVASVIRELVANDYVTGEVFTVDGGLTSRIC